MNLANDEKMMVMENALRKSYMDQTVVGEGLDHKLVINDAAKKKYVINDLTRELNQAESFFFSVAFVTQSGLNELKTQLADLALKGIEGRLLTSNYLGFNSPEAYESLLRIPNLEVRISTRHGFHAKGYLFKKLDHYTLIVGSSNLTRDAVRKNYEWNILMNSFENGQVIQQTFDFMESEWEESQPLTQEWIESYRKVYKKLKQQTVADIAVVSEENSAYEVNTNQEIKPNKMQEVALKNIEELRRKGEKRGLVISATGTGKTYLSAFDVRQVKPKRFLFIVHREQILSKARDEFHKILGGDKSDFRILSGSKKETESRYLFSTIQTISKENYLEQFAKDHFDYILIDEVHKAGADSYKRVIDYFTPMFLLGMTATPDRTDGFDIYGLFDYNIAYEIRLQEALEEEMLTPFNYFGVTDYMKDGLTVEETSDLQFLVADERVDFLLEKIKYYGCDGNVAKGLVFCSQKKEVKELADKFNQKGYPSAYLTGDHTVEERERVVRQLEEGELSYIFTVDVFNEGIDIPKVNQVIMLRNTKSNIIFIQQLGRGLRKHHSKEFVTVIDFIGNYQNNYMIPMALTGDSSRNKNSLRRDTFESNFMSGVSSINFEAIAKERVYKSIDKASLDSMVELRKSFEELKNRLGRTPYLVDFQQSGVLEPLVAAKKYGSYYDFLLKVKEEVPVLDSQSLAYLKMASNEFLPGHRLHEQVLLTRLIEKDELTNSEIVELFKSKGIAYDDKTIRSVKSVLDVSFFAGSNASTYKSSSFIEVTEDGICLTTSFKDCYENTYFAKLLTDIFETALLKNNSYHTDKPLTLHEKYTRKEVLKLLNWEKEMVPLNIGGYTYKDGEFVIFVTLKKGEEFKGAQVAYRDRFLSSSRMKLYSKTGRSLTSNEVKILQSPDDWTIRLFIQKSNDEGKDFYYMGEVKPIADSIIEVEEPIESGEVKSLVEYDVQLVDGVDDSLYRYLLSGDE
ncbi:DEAD/DEAH box helicase [Vagococcus fessus]